MTTLHEVIEYHAREAERAVSPKKRQQHRYMQTLIEAFLLDTKTQKAKSWLMRSVP